MSNEFEKIFERLARTDDPNVIFTQWLDYVIDQNLYTLKNRGLDFKGREQDYLDMFIAWVENQQAYFENNPDKYWYDYLGHFYEDVIQSKFRAGSRGQFFTPSNVCDAMAELTFHGKPKEHYDGKLINDCAGGSGRLLLASKQFAPNGIFILHDLDSVAVKMAALNFFIHGIRGAVICKNTLTGEFFEAYRINNYLGTILPTPHIEICNTEAEACNILGINREDKQEAIEVNNNTNDDNDDDGIAIPEPVQTQVTGQTTLI
ncbi:N-6 DNA methylase [Methanobrevibacter sp.]|uniref:N-6 DNA methylase n=1 Tax=Methanobrevibacter sp. TaxID=66852 RepID=UPI00386AA6CB